jgi:hypothetical protein
VRSAYSWVRLALKSGGELVIDHTRRVDFGVDRRGKRRYDKAIYLLRLSRPVQVKPCTALRFRRGRFAFVQYITGCRE